MSDILNNYFGEAMQQYLPKYELGKVYTFKSINEGPAVKKLRIFDFDDTLIKVNSSIHVKNNKKKFILTPAEFAVYNPKKGDVFNFKEFDAIIKTFAPIQTNLKLLKQSAESPTTKTTILTARLLGYPVKYFLKKNFGLDIYVIALGSSDPQKKANYIEKEIKKGYNDIVFIDDSHKNVKAVEALQSQYPNVNLKVIHTTEAEHIKF